MPSRGEQSHLATPRKTTRVWILLALVFLLAAGTFFAVAGAVGRMRGSTGELIATLAGSKSMRVHVWNDGAAGGGVTPSTLDRPTAASAAKVAAFGGRGLMRVGAVAIARVLARSKIAGVVEVRAFGGRPSYSAALPLSAAHAAPKASQKAWARHIRLMSPPTKARTIFLIIVFLFDSWTRFVHSQAPEGPTTGRVSWPDERRPGRAPPCIKTHGCPHAARTRFVASRKARGRQRNTRYTLDGRGALRCNALPDSGPDESVAPRLPALSASARARACTKRPAILTGLLDGCSAARWTAANLAHVAATMARSLVILAHKSHRHQRCLGIC